MPSRFLYVPRTTSTSSSLRTGIERTLYFATRSFESGALMIVRRSVDDAVKCALRHFRREEETVAELFIF